MYHNRDQFVLLNGRVIKISPPSPGYRSPEDCGLPPPSPPPWLLSAMVGTVRRMLQHPAPSRADDPKRPARPARPIDRASYLELEFAVGFGPDDEPWG